MVSSRDLPDRIGGPHLGVTSAEAVAGAKHLAETLRSAGKQVVPLDPDSPAGKAAAEAVSEVLAEIAPAVERRRAAARAAAKDARP